MSLLDIDGDRLLDALMVVLADKGIAAPAEIEAQIALTDRASPAAGAAMVARAWTDPAFLTLLLADGRQAAERFGIAMRGAPPLGVLDNTGTVHHLVVCTLCSCYPRAVLGYPPFWFKSPAYRARAVRDPRGVLAEWAPCCPPARRSASWIPPPIIGGWCCRRDRMARKAGVRRVSPRWCARAT